MLVRSSGRLRPSPSGRPPIGPDEQEPSGRPPDSAKTAPSPQGSRANLPILPGRGRKESPVLHTEPLGEGVGLRLYGELADVDVGLAAAAFDRLAEIGGDITLDLVGVTFMDSMGLGKLIVLASGLTGRGHLRLVNVRPPLMRVFELVSPRRPLANMTVEPLTDVA